MSFTELFSIVHLCLTLISILYSIYLTIRITRLTKGGDGKTLESTIRALIADTKKNTQHLDTIDSRLATLEARMRRGVRNVQTHRFDPFEGGSGSGKQSFAVALLDDEGNGAVISSLHTHDKVRVFAKPISQFSSPHELSLEEKRVIADSRTK